MKCSGDVRYDGEAPMTVGRVLVYRHVCERCLAVGPTASETCTVGVWLSARVARGGNPSGVDLQPILTRYLR
jgi:hypothetical protein